MTWLNIFILTHKMLNNETQSKTDDKHEELREEKRNDKTAKDSLEQNLFLTYKWNYIYQKKRLSRFYWKISLNYIYIYIYIYYLFIFLSKIYFITFCFVFFYFFEKSLNMNWCAGKRKRQITYPFFCFVLFIFFLLLFFFFFVLVFDFFFFFFWWEWEWEATLFSFLLYRRLCSSAQIFIIALTIITFFFTQVYASKFFQVSRAFLYSFSDFQFFFPSLWGSFWVYYRHFHVPQLFQVSRKI